MATKKKKAPATPTYGKRAARILAHRAKMRAKNTILAEKASS